MSDQRAALVAYRAAVLGLAGDQSLPTDVLLDAGVQDHPTGTTARLALMLRGSDGGGALVHSVRAATHLHHRSDVGVLASALRIDDAGELAKQSIGPFGAEIGAGFGTAMDEVAAVMRDVMSDGVARAKGELSGAVSPKVRPVLAPWCAGCGVHHVQDALFRFASLQAGLSIHVEPGPATRYVADVSFEPVPVDEARARLVRRLLRVAGPSRPQQLASWLALTPAAARQWWSLVAGELEEVEVDGRGAWIHRADAALLADPPEPDPLRLIGPYDPLTEFADREFVVPDATRRRQVWAPTANPGVVVARGEIVGTWRRRTTKRSLTITLKPFDDLPVDWRDLAAADAQAIARFLGRVEVQLDLDS